MDLAYRAVAAPVEGTVLTVARAAADAVQAQPGSLAEAVTTAVDAAEAALAHTPELLVALERAGVVDAGGQGYVLVLDALARTVAGGDAWERPRPLVATPPRRVHHTAEDTSFEYEVQYLLAAPEPAAAELRRRLSALGDSVVVAAIGDGSWNVHAHVDDAGAAIEAGVAAGATRAISVVRFADDLARPGGGTAAVLVLAGDDRLVQLFAREGVAAVDRSGPDIARRVLAAAAGTGARDLVLLPNDPQATSLAETAAEQLRGEGMRVVVIPTRSPVQGLAAVAVHDGKRRFDDDVVAMAEAAAATRFAQVCVAGEQALTSVGMCRAGDVLGLVEGDVVEIGSDLQDVAIAMVERLLGVGGELVTVLLAADAPDSLADAVVARVRARAPLTDVCTYRVGRSDVPLVLGIE